MAIGEKIYRSSLINSSQWWSQVIRSKYLSPSNDRAGHLASRWGSPIWQLINSSRDLIPKYLSKIPGNGATINIFIGSILILQSLDSDQYLEDLCLFLESRGVVLLD